MPRPPLALRFAALLSIAAIALHEARYLIGFGDHAGKVLAARGHGYMPLAGVLAVILLGLAASHLLLAIARARRTGSADSTAPGMGATWLVASFALLAVYGGQEVLEGLVAGHFSVAHLIGDSGLVVLPIALVLGALVALFMRGAAEAVERAARRERSLHLPRALRAVPHASRVAGPRRSLIALRLAGRAPPLSA